MRTTIVAALASIYLVLVSCGFEYTETQDIQISHFSNDEKNAKLAEDLMYYDPAFLVDQIPALNEETSKGLRLGYSVRSSDGRPSYRVTYNRAIDAVSTNIDDLKSQFDAYIPVLAAQHASKESLFLQLIPVGLAWIQEFFSSDAAALMEKSSPLLRQTATVDQLSEYQAQISSRYGSPTDIEFVRAQYYTAFAGVPESVSLFYRANMTDDSSLMVRVSTQELDADWRTIGFGFNAIP